MTLRAAAGSLPPPSPSEALRLIHRPELLLRKMFQLLDQQLWDFLGFCLRSTSAVQGCLPFGQMDPGYQALGASLLWSRRPLGEQGPL